MTNAQAVNGQPSRQVRAAPVRTVLVVGDLMLDHTVDGQAARLSPEAPVPVLTVAEERYSLGGAANVARNLAALGARVLLAGVAGRDRHGAQMCILLGEAGIDVSAVLVTERRTTVKTRFIANTQQLLRVDSEQAEPIGECEEAELTKRLAHTYPDAVIVSDYAKGVITEGVVRAVCRLARTCNAPVVVDPKRSNFARFAGCTAITPNAAEAAAATGVPVRDNVESEAAGKILLVQTGATAVLITRGRHGLTLVTAERTHHIPAQAVEVFDVAGAGDALVAAFTHELTRGASVYEAAGIANIAAGLAVQARGVAAVNADQLRRAVEAHEPAAEEDVLTASA